MRTPHCVGRIQRQQTLVTGATSGHVVRLDRAEHQGGEPAHEAGANAIRDRISQALGRDKPDPRLKLQHELEEERKRQRQLALER